jgi:hypothetical protein
LWDWFRLGKMTSGFFAIRSAWMVADTSNSAPGVLDVAGF